MIEAVDIGQERLRSGRYPSKYMLYELVSFKVSKIRRLSI